MHRGDLDECLKMNKKATEVRPRFAVPWGNIGFIMNKIDEEDAMESLRVYREILEALDEEERRAFVLEDEKVNGEAREAPLGDNCANREAP